MDPMKIIKLSFDQQAELTHLDDMALHGQYLLLGIGRVANKDQIVYFRHLICLLILGSNPQRSDTHQLQPSPRYDHLTQIHIDKVCSNEESLGLKLILHVYID